MILEHIKIQAPLIIREELLQLNEEEARLLYLLGLCEPILTYSENEAILLLEKKGMIIVNKTAVKPKDALTITTYGANCLKSIVEQGYCAIESWFPMVKAAGLPSIATMVRDKIMPAKELSELSEDLLSYWLSINSKQPVTNEPINYTDAVYTGGVSDRSFITASKILTISEGINITSNSNVQDVKHELHYQLALEALIKQAEQNGFVLSIHNEPQSPLAMGNYKMIPGVRKKLIR